MISALGHADRAAPFRSYCTGLLLPGDRKSVEPMAARVEPGRVQAAHQSLHHFVAKAEWSDDAVLAAVRCQIASNRDPSFACNADPSVVRASAFFVIGRGLST